MIKKNIAIFLFFLIIINSLYSTDNFYYENLNKDERIVYNEIKSAILQKNENLELNLFDFDIISKVYYSVLNDNPEMFYVTNHLNYNSSLINDKIVSAKVNFDYKEEFDSNEIKKTNSKLNYIKYRLFFETIGFSNYDIAKTCFEYICKNATYDLSVDDQSLYSVLIDNKGVCASYAKSFKYLMDFFNIPNYIVEGKFINSNENHAWNMIKLNDSWYHVDVTQADANENYIDYSYFCSIDNQILKDHKIESIIPIYPAKSTEYFYLETIGCYFKTFNQDLLKHIIVNHIEDNNESLVITFENNYDFNKSLNFLIDNSNLFHIILNEGYLIENIDYIINEYSDTIIFIFDDMEKDENIIKVENYSKSYLESLILDVVKRGSKEIKILFTNKEDYDKARELLLENQYIFEIIDDIESLEIITYEDVFRFDILI